LNIKNKYYLSGSRLIGGLVGGYLYEISCFARNDKKKKCRDCFFAFLPAGEGGLVKEYFFIVRATEGS